MCTICEWIWISILNYNKRYILLKGMILSGTHCNSIQTLGKMQHKIYVLQIGGLAIPALIHSTDKTNRVIIFFF